MGGRVSDLDRIVTVKPTASLIARELAGEDETERFFGPTLDDEILHPSVILADRSRLDYRVGELYEVMPQRDTTLGGLLQKREDAVLSLPRFLDPPNGSPKALEIRDFCRKALSQVSQFAVVQRHLLGAVSRGFAPAEVMWHRPTSGPLSGAWAPEAIVDRPMWRFGFRWATVRGRRRQGLFVRRPRLGESVDAPPAKFVCHRTGTLDDPWGCGAKGTLLDRVYWAAHLKIHGWKYYAVYLERWAQPIARGSYDQPTTGGTTDQAKMATLEAAIRRIQTESGLVLPPGFKIDLLEATRSGAATYEQFIATIERSMAIAILGEVDTSGQGRGPGSYAKSRVSNEVRKEKIALDAHDLSTTLRDQLLRPLVALNYGLEAAFALTPEFRIEVESAEDRAARQEAAEKLLDRGQPIAVDDYYRVMGVRRPREDEEVLRFPPRQLTESLAPVVPDEMSSYAVPLEEAA